MRLIAFLLGWIWWHIKAGFWYATLVFRLYFAVGLDRDVHSGKEQDMGQFFKYKGERSYRRHLQENDQAPF